MGGAASILSISPGRLILLVASLAELIRRSNPTGLARQTGRLVRTWRWRAARRVCVQWVRA